MKNTIWGAFERVGPLKFFVVLSCIFGMTFLLLAPPFQGADEPVHFFRAYQISEGHLVSTKTADGKVGGYLPADIRQIFHITESPSVQFYPQLKYKIGATKAALEVPRSHQNIFYAFPASASYPPIAYPLSSFGILLTRLLHMPTMVALYAARLGNLLTWIILVGVAIYVLPSRKWALVAVGLLPMALFQASTLNGDAVTFGTVILLLSLILKIRAENTHVTRKMGLLILALSAAMVLTKDVMFFFLPLALLIRKESFQAIGQSRIFKAGIIILPLVLFCGWLYLTRNISSAAAFDNGQNPTKQMHFILSSPYSYVNVLWNTYFYTWGDSITRSLVGDFGWSDAPLSESIVVIGYLGLALLFMGSYEKKYKEVLSSKSRQLIASVAAVYWLAVSTALYVYYTPAGFKIIVGLQGRYYIPLLMLAIPLFRVKGIRIDPLLYRRVAISLPIFLLVCSTITIYVRYFVNNV
jgi:uncharacterized membrane protein